MDPGTSFRRKLGKVKLATRLTIPELAKDRMMRFGLPAMAGGAILAATVKVISDQREAEAARKEMQKTREMGGRGVELRIAEAEAPVGTDKQAAADEFWGDTSIPRGGYLSDVPASLLALTVPGIVTYKLLMRKFRNDEKGDVAADIEKLKSRHLDFISGAQSDGGSGYLAPLNSLASRAEEATRDSPRVEGVDRKSSKKEAEGFISDGVEGVKTLSASAIGGMTSLALLAGIATHINRLRKERALDKMYEDESSSREMKAMNIDTQYHPSASGEF